MKSFLVTGANAGLGKETARQLAMLSTTEKIYLGCRNKEKAMAAIRELENLTGRSVFDVLLIDVSDTESVKAAVSALAEPVDGLVMNAGGAGGEYFNKLTKDGVTEQFAVNVLGHVVLLDELLKSNKLLKVAVYAGSEAARGIKEMGIKAPEFARSSVEEFVAVCDGSFFGENTDSQLSYGPVKYLAAQWMASMSRQFPQIRFITMSPGATKGTDALNSLPLIKKLMFRGMLQMMYLFGKVHKVETGAKRFVSGLTDSSLSSGVFYASESGASGSVTDQGTMYPEFYNQRIQDNAHKAIYSFIK